MIAAQVRPVDWWDPYHSVPAWADALMWVLLGATVVSYVAIFVLMLHAVGEPRRQRRVFERGDMPGEEEYLWVFLVPALDEEVTIADSVGRLAGVEATHRVILVIDDGSEDRTPEILAGLDVPGLTVLRRDPPNARKGKAAGLDAAWDHLERNVLTLPEHVGRSRDHVIVCVVDADGRLSPEAPHIVAPYFGDPWTGGVQVLVRIYNRRHYLTWSQDLEFGVFGYIYQLGRSRWGTANMGGNGQFNRLSALDDVVATEDLPEGVERGPWRDRLTEDQDIGVRLLQYGWHGHQTVRTTVEQQGVTNLRRLYRQRTRWAQGAWQSIALLWRTGRISASWLARADAFVYLIMPILQVAMGLGLVLAVVFWGFFHVAFYSLWWPVLIFALGLSFFAGFAGLFVGIRRGWRGLLFAVVGIVPYMFYTWLIYPALVRALFRWAFGSGTWAKTAREPMDENLPAVSEDAEVTTEGTEGPKGSASNPSSPV
ncbi:glycosyltransferase family 2 protein [Luteimicrobium subarcticum]|uniref:Cellulose synthase/poly-beta-1,6-N-acetylglucosamine synthase-like glycosyltransferase n=1 Tax=Luteimicrobium subarcticum TaxID=620910 RepID=A0A2M8WSI5_9MICO|nr:glycosyltransferase [Luteimicrobium subarcticum]PJI93854.1 cellulose synthase/poly-beta-1,6-N-acetylglucosamine synthase-like glycosyltransferase [Luteimicrobium subarcticum]